MYDKLQGSGFGQLPLWKKIGIIIGVLFLVSVIFTVLKIMLFSYSARSISSNMGFQAARDGMMLSVAEQEMVYENDAGLAKNDLARSTAPSPSYSTGGDAEAYESLSYIAQYRTADHSSICATVESWKPLQHVVFEHAQKTDTYCRYNFKVKREQAEEFVTKLKELNPTEFIAEIDSLKKQVVRYEGKLDILLKRQEILQNTLYSAEMAYDRLTSLADSLEEVEALTEIINSKLATIERLTQQQVSLSQQIDSVARSASELQDKIEYVYFSVNVQKYTLFDGERIKDSWVLEVQKFVRVVNGTLQQLTLGVLTLFVWLLMVLVYISIVGLALLLFGRFAWQFVKTFWGSKKEKQQEYTHNT